VISLKVNGVERQIDADPDMPLLWALRDLLKLTGTKYGCGIAQCGACTVLLDGRPVKSCSILALQAQGRAVTTVEGLASADTLHPLQEAFSACHGLQCGFCTPGMLMAASGLLARQPHPTEEDIVRALEGNLCRCTGYVNIVKAVQQAAHTLAQRGTP